MQAEAQRMADELRREFEAGLDGSGLAQGDLATWEIRARLVATPGEAPRIEADGGYRIDEHHGGSRWIVAGDPRGEALRGAAGRTSIERWEAACRRIDGLLRRELPAAETRAARHAAAWSDAGLRIEATRVELRVAVVLQGRTNRGLLRAAGLTGGELRLSWCDAGRRTTHSCLLDDEAREPAPPARVSAPTTFASIEAGTYPVRLDPHAAAYCLHELGHAAVERGREPRAACGDDEAQLVEDPGAAPHPFGFTRDDLGEEAPVSVLWGATGRHTLPPGHARRDTLSATPRPAMSFTRLVGARSASRRGPPAPAARLRVSRVSAARYDPALDRLFLAVPELEIEDARGRSRTTHGGLLTTTAREAWTGLEFEGGEAGAHTVLARCTRLGCVLPVMVGAPTIDLRSMQFIPAFSCQPRDVG